MDGAVSMGASLLGALRAFDPRLDGALPALREARMSGDAAVRAAAEEALRQLGE